MAKRKEIDISDAVIRMLQNPGSVTAYRPILNPEDGYTLTELKELAVNEGVIFMIEDEPEEDPKDKWKVVPVVMELPKQEAPEQEANKFTPKGDKIDDGKILALKKAGWTDVAIAEELGISNVTVGKHLKKMGYTDAGNDN